MRNRSERGNVSMEDEEDENLTQMIYNIHFRRYQIYTFSPRLILLPISYFFLGVLYSRFPRCGT